MTVVTALRRVFGIPLALLLALLLQVVLVNRLSRPGGGAPDLVLLVVAATGATAGPLAGLLAGFCGGLALDIAPPGGHLAGEYALIFCLVGYGCGRLRAVADPMEEHGSVISVAVTAVGVAGGEVAKAGLGMMLSDPEVTGPVIKHVLPGAVLYDLLLCPFVLWLIAAAVRGPAPARAADPHQRRSWAMPQYGALRLAGAGAAPRLKLGGGSLATTRAPRRTEPRLKLGGGSLTAARAPRRKEPKLRLAGSSSPLSARTARGGSPGSLPPSARRPVSLNFSGASRGRGGAGTAVPRRKSPGKGWLRSSGTAGLARFSGSALSARPAVPNFRRHRPGTGWLRPGKAAASSRRSSPGRGWLKAGKPAGPAYKRKSPAKGWLHGGRRRRKGGWR